MQDAQTFNMHEFCSRKLWEIVRERAADDENNVSQEELLAAVRELAQRRHYLAELESIGKLKPQN
jgi:threonine synthase